MGELPTIVIEAPGKIQAISHALDVNRIPYHAVVATKGHFVNHPNSLTPLGITRDFKEPGRTADPKRLEQLRTACAGRCVIIATDDDQEGNVIATDVYKHVNDVATSTYRAVFKDISPNTIGKSFKKLKPINPKSAIPGNARRIVDRLIGNAFSRSYFGCGRVSSALLGSFMRREPPIGHLIMQLNAADGGPPFISKVSITRENQNLWFKRLAEVESMKPADAKQVVFAEYQPLSFSELVLHISNKQQEMTS